MKISVTVTEEMMRTPPDPLLLVQTCAIAQAAKPKLRDGLTVRARHGWLEIYNQMGVEVCSVEHDGDLIIRDYDLHHTHRRPLTCLGGVVELDIPAEYLRPREGK